MRIRGGRRGRNIQTMNKRSRKKMKMSVRRRRQISNMRGHTTVMISKNRVNRRKRKRQAWGLNRGIISKETYWRR